MKENTIPVQAAKVLENLRHAIRLVGKDQTRDQSKPPDWRAAVAPLGLPQEKADGLVRALDHLRLLPFGDIEVIADLLVFQYVELPAIRADLQKRADTQGIALCDLFELLTKMVMQGFSLFPQNPANLAQQVREALLSPLEKRDPLIPLLELLIDPTTGQPAPGLNAVDIADPDFVLQCERDRRQGFHEGSWKAPFKYTQFEQSVRDDPRFRADWDTIKRRFPVDSFRDAEGILRRSKIEEGSWHRPMDSNLADPGNRFQVVFDFFCWKWFLYGMRGDEPMVQKLACNLTPYGTLIFIPGYWSLDPHRDIIWSRVVRLHRARGIERQGQKLASDKKERRTQLNKLLRANRDAQQQKLRGQARYLFLKQQAGFTPQTDDAHIRRLLRQARQK